MYAFDEKGNVLIDGSQTSQIEEATRNRTISRRAYALVNNQFSSFQPIQDSTWHSFQIRLGEVFGNIWRSMKVPVRQVSTPRGGADLKNIYNKIVIDWVSNDLQGFKGALPIVELQGSSDMIFFLPADGAVIRYLGRLVRKHPGLIDVHIGRGDGYLSSRMTTLDGNRVDIGDHSNCMTLRVVERFSIGVNRIDNNVSLLKGMRRLMQISSVQSDILKIFTTLSRKLRNHDGTWGEAPKFPIVNFARKCAFGEFVRIEAFDQNFHGNNKDLYADRAVYNMMDDKQKYPFSQIQVSRDGGSGSWISPRE